MSEVKMSSEQYMALIALARVGVANAEQARTLEAFLADIDANNNVTRYVLLVQWQELDSPIPPGMKFPEKWPPELRLFIERTDRPVAKADVLKALSKKAKNPHQILVTRDPAGIVGWTQIDKFFVT
jgi:hypothetical protein